ncbi:MAG TPA: hypothetical protein VGS13_04525 [Stellaceae bacterium]|nr:hypothetical protein [Stellaceae bacterium]
MSIVRICSSLPAVLALIAGIGLAPTARADFKVKMPDAEPGELELETIGNYGQSGNPAIDSEQNFVHELEYGVNNFWRTALEFETNRPGGPGQHLKFDQLTWENFLQLTERGQYWLDAGLFFEYGRAMIHGAPDETTFGPMLRKEIGPTINTVNLFLEKDLGRFSGGRPNFIYAWETRLALGGIVDPGFQAYGQPGAFGHFLPIGAQDHRIGPQLFGEIHQLGPGTLKWNGGILIGLTPVTPRRTLRWQLEYEIHF